MYNFAEKVVIAGFVLFGLFMLFIVISQYLDCQEIGGSFVRGLFWFECL